MKSIIININPENTDILLGKENFTVYETEYIEEKIGNINLKLNTASFFQINTAQCEVLYKNINTSIEQNNTVLDAHCGVGSIRSLYF